MSFDFVLSAHERKLLHQCGFQRKLAVVVSVTNSSGEGCNIINEWILFIIFFRFFLMEQ